MNREIYKEVVYKDNVCPVCGKEGIPNRAEKNAEGYGMTLVKCRECGYGVLVMRTIIKVPYRGKENMDDWGDEFKRVDE